MTYVVIVSRVTVEDRITELTVLAVHRDLELEAAMRLLGQRPPGTVGRVQRLPADLPEPGEVLRLEAQGQLFNAPITRRAGGRP